MKESEINDESVGHIDISPIRSRFTDNLTKLIDLVEQFGFTVRIVGGAVRDLMLGHRPRDIDLLTDALPDEILYVLAQNEIQISSKGIGHGTIKAKFGEDEEYEITSLAFEIEQDGDRLHVRSHRSWSKDALRRDFTVNAMSVDLKGNLYDYLNGLSDLKNEIIRPIGNYEEKVKHDPVLILRFFKMLSTFKNPKFNADMLDVIRRTKRLLNDLKEKRIHLELDTIEKGPSAEPAMALMCKLGLKKFLDMVCPIQEQVNTGDFAKDMILWNDIDKEDFLLWLFQNIVTDQEDQEIARQNPDEYRDYLYDYMNDRVQQPFIKPIGY